MKVYLTLCIILTSIVGISQIDLQFQDPCTSCGVYDPLSLTPTSMIYKSSDGTQAIGYFKKQPGGTYYQSSDGFTNTSRSANYYLICAIAVPSKPLSKSFRIRLNDNTTYNLTQVDVEFDENTGMYIVSGRKRITSKSKQRKVKLYHITHIEVDNELAEVDGNVSRRINIAFNCIFYR